MNIGPELHPRVTVLIPTRNRSQLLRRAIASVAGQTFKQWELVISDNASTDDTEVSVEQLRAEDARIRYFRHPENIGMLGNWASLIGRADKEYFCVLSDDDILLPRFLETAVNALDLDHELGMCFGRTSIIDNQGLHYGYAPSEMRPGRYAVGSGAAAMVRAQHPASTGTLFRTAAVGSVGGFDSSAHYVADLDIMLRVASSRPVLFVGDEFAFHIAHAGNSFKDGASWFPGLLALLKNMQTAEKLSNPQKEEIARCLIVNSVFPFALQFIRCPFSTWRGSNWRCAIECMANTPHPWSIVAMLPGYLMKRTLSFSLRKVREFYSVVSGSPHAAAKGQLHPSAEGLL